MSNEVQWLLVAVACLAGVVALLFGLVQSYHRDTSRRLVECERDRGALWRAIRRRKGRPGRK